MAKQNKPTGHEAQTAVDPVEQKLVAFAEQLGRLVGTVQAKAEGWMDHPKLAKELGRIRDRAADLLEHVNPMATSGSKPGAARAKAPAKRVSRGPVDAPGKSHRKPVAHERIDKRMGEPQGKQMGQKSAKMGRRGGRG